MKFAALYQYSPSWIQNLAISAYGGLQYVQRYRSSLKFPYNQLQSFNDVDSDQIQMLQWARLKELIDHASMHVPYYRDMFASLGIDIKDIKPDTFSEIFPVITKEDILAAPERFQSEVGRKGALNFYTSGTSGSPLHILSSRNARRINYAYYRYILASGGCDVRDRSVTFAGRPLVRSEAKGNYWRYDYLTSTMYCSSYHISDATIPSYIDALERWSPTYIDSYPSAIATIASYIVNRGITTTIRPRLIFTSSETLDAQQKDYIHRAFSCPIIDQYGCTEMAAMAWSTGDIYTVEPLYGLVEFDQICDQSHALICTGLLNEQMPLFRYRIGDVVRDVESDSPNALGRKRFGRIDGRTDDFIITPEGRKIGRMDPAFKGIEGVRRAQIHQVSRSELVVRIVFISKSENERALDALRANIKARTSSQMQVTFEILDDIPLEASGKFKAVKSDVVQTLN